MRVKILDVNVETVTKGKNSYQKAAVTYTYNGEARTQNVMSFTNPAVFKAVKEKVGQEAEVTVIKNGAGYNTWSAVEDVGTAPAASAASSPATGPTRVIGNNYETPAERATRQVYIIKQSSLSTAVALAASNKEKATPAEIIANAQQFVDWVFDKPITEMENDIPF
jgi:hypothetical protein